MVAIATAQDPKPPVVDLTKGRKVENPFTTRVAVQSWEKGKHRATYENAHANYLDIKDGPKGAYRIWRVRAVHVGGTPTENGWKVVDADGKVWVAFETKPGMSLIIFNCRPETEKKP